MSRILSMILFCSTLAGCVGMGRQELQYSGTRSWPFHYAENPAGSGEEKIRRGYWEQESKETTTYHSFILLYADSHDRTLNEKILKGEYQSACGFYTEGNPEKILANEPARVAFWNNRGVCQFLMGNAKDSLRSLDTAFSHDPGNPDILSNKRRMMDLIAGMNE